MERVLAVIELCTSCVGRLIVVDGLATNRHATL